MCVNIVLMQPSHLTLLVLLHFLLLPSFLQHQRARVIVGFPSLAVRFLSREGDLEVRQTCVCGCVSVFSRQAMSRTTGRSSCGGCTIVYTSECWVVCALKGLSEDIVRSIACCSRTGKSVLRKRGGDRDREREAERNTVCVQNDDLGRHVVSCVSMYPPLLVMR